MTDRFSLQFSATQHRLVKVKYAQVSSITNILYPKHDHFRPLYASLNTDITLPCSGHFPPKKRKNLMYMLWLYRKEGKRWRNFLWSHLKGSSMSFNLEKEGKKKPTFQDEWIPSFTTKVNLIEKFPAVLQKVRLESYPPKCFTSGKRTTKTSQNSNRRSYYITCLLIDQSVISIELARYLLYLTIYSSIKASTLV